MLSTPLLFYLIIFEAIINNIINLLYNFVCYFNSCQKEKKNCEFTKKNCYIFRLIININIY